MVEKEYHFDQKYHGCKKKSLGQNFPDITKSNGIDTVAFCITEIDLIK